MFDSVHVWEFVSQMGKKRKRILTAAEKAAKRKRSGLHFNPRARLVSGQTFHHTSTLDLSGPTTVQIDDKGARHTTVSIASRRCGRGNAYFDISITDATGRVTLNSKAISV
jgi:hypothetical protein